MGGRERRKREGKEKELSSTSFPGILTETDRKLDRKYSSWDLNHCSQGYNARQSPFSLSSP